MGKLGKLSRGTYNQRIQLKFYEKKDTIPLETNRIFFNVSEFVIIVRLSDLKRDDGRKISTVPVFFFHVAFV